MKKVVRIRWVCVFLFLIQGMGAELHAKTTSTKEDSLRHCLSIARTDTEKIQLLKTLIAETRFSNTGEALTEAKQMLELALQGKNMKTIASSYNTIGIVSRQIGDNDKAIGYVYKCLRLYEQMKDTANLAGSYLNLASCFNAKGDDDKALSLFRKALEIFNKLHNKLGLAFCYNNIATIYSSQKKNEQALDYYRKSLALKLEIGERKSVGTVYMNIGIVQQNLKLYDSALISYTKSLRFCLAQNNLDGVCNVYLNLAELDIAKKDFKQASAMLDSAMQLATELKGIESLGAIHRSYFHLYESTGKPEQALYHFEQFLIFKDSILNESNTRQVADMGARYESEKREKVIQLLKKESDISQVQHRKDKIFIGGLACAIAGVVLLGLLLLSRFRFREKVNHELSRVNAQINEQKKEITDSIHYALRIQQAILLSPDKILDILPESFLLHRPKQIVSGDFYWIHKQDDEITIAIVDNVLNGVPGAFISLVGINLLNSAIQEKRTRGLNDLRHFINDGIISTLRQVGKTETISSKLNYVICRVNTLTKTMECITTDNPVLVVSSSGIKEYKRGEEAEPMVHTLQLKTTDLVCIFTNGYADGPGEKNGNEFLSHTIGNSLVETAPLSLSAQKKKLETILDAWKEQHELVDDTLLLAFRI
jgi:tetratricopeptide (TPR) repeat protein